MMSVRDSCPSKWSRQIERIWRCLGYFPAWKACSKNGYKRDCYTFFAKTRLYDWPTPSEWQDLMSSWACSVGRWRTRVPISGTTPGGNHSSISALPRHRGQPRWRQWSCWRNQIADYKLIEMPRRQQFAFRESKKSVEEGWLLVGNGQFNVASKTLHIVLDVHCTNETHLPFQKASLWVAV